MRQTLFHYQTISHENNTISNLTSKAHFVSNDYHVHAFFGEILHDSKYITGGHSKDTVANIYMLSFGYKF